MDRRSLFLIERQNNFFDDSKTIVVRPNEPGGSSLYDVSEEETPLQGTLFLSGQNS